MRNSLLIASLSVLLLASLLPATAQTAPKDEFILIVKAGDRDVEALALALRNELNTWGVDLTIIAHPNYAFHDRLYRQDTWDMAIYDFMDFGASTPKLAEYYSCNGVIGERIFKLCESDTWETMLSPAEQERFKRLLFEMAHPNSTEHLETVTSEFQNIFMNQLLLDAPLLKRDSRVVQANSVPLSTDPIMDILQGFAWSDTDNPAGDNQSLKLVRDTIDPFFLPFFYHPDQGKPIDNQQARSGIFPTLGFVDNNGDQHPNVAASVSRQNWEEAPTIASDCTDQQLRDCVNTNQSQTIEDGKITYTFGNYSMYWINASAGYQQTDVPITPADFAFTFNLFLSDNYWLPHQDAFDTIYEVEADQQAGTLTLYSLRPNTDETRITQIPVIPHHLFNETLTYTNGSPTYASNRMPPADTSDMLNPDELGINAILRLTQEFDQFASQPWTGGPYYIDYNVSTQGGSYNSIVKVQNPNYWYPNMALDSPNGEFVEGQDPSIDILGFNGSARVTTFHINRIEYELNLDSYRQVERMIAKIADQALIHAPIEFIFEQLEEADLQTNSIDSGRSFERLLFNLQTEQLQDYQLRKAFVQAFNNSVIQEINSFNTVQQAPLAQRFSAIYSPQYFINYDPDAAQAAFESLGYSQNSTNQPSTTTTTPSTTLPPTESEDGTTFIRDSNLVLWGGLVGVILLQILQKKRYL